MAVARSTLRSNNKETKAMTMRKITRTTRTKTGGNGSSCNNTEGNDGKSIKLVMVRATKSM